MSSAHRPVLVVAHPQHQPALRPGDRLLDGLDLEHRVELGRRVGGAGDGDGLAEDHVVAVAALVPRDELG